MVVKYFEVSRASRQRRGTAKMTLSVKLPHYQAWASFWNRWLNWGPRGISGIEGQRHLLMPNPLDISTDLRAGCMQVIMAL